MSDILAEDYAITFACFNSLRYTRMCIESLVGVGTPLSRLVVVDNCSTDATREYLEGLSLGGRIYNKENMACGVAWNQGVLHLQAEWTVVMNNDLIVSPRWIERLIGVAKKNGLRVVSPALVEGDLDYDFPEYAENSAKRMAGSLRKNTQHAVCVCIHRSVFMDVGFFRPTPSLLGFEDAIFFQALRKSAVQTGMTGEVWLHHFGSITQSEMKRARGIRESDVLVRVNDRELLQQSWLERKIERYQRKKRQAAWRSDELMKYGMTMHAERKDGGFRWC